MQHVPGPHAGGLGPVPHADLLALGAERLAPGGHDHEMPLLEIGDRVEDVVQVRRRGPSHRPSGDKTQDAKSRSELINDLRREMREEQENARKAYWEIKQR